MEDSELNMMYEKEKPMVKVSESSLRNSVWPSLKPFVNGGLAAVLPLSSVYFLQSCVYHILNAMIKSSGQELINPKWLHQTHFNVSQRMPFVLSRRGINMAALLGSYEIFTRKVEALNKGSPLTIYQEAACGLISATFRAYICYPLIEGHVAAGIAQAVTLKHNRFGHIFSTITRVVRNEGPLALWKGASRVNPVSLASCTGMLVSYDRTRIYLKERYGLRENAARLGAGIFSGMCSGACTISVCYAAEIIGFIRSKRVKSPHSFLFYALKVLEPGGGSNFYSRLGKQSVRNAPGVMMVWVLLEAIRDAEESIGL
ncbi:mitochondrial dicarboxylate/tricarboxylate transporter DTC-like [Nicotiana sylvestris]|uniref:Mitochondrial dicarboxylate/tricarboxylate transporter DTC-like n=1 Tax=Nicotiana sylvestris TaxID=4096 RepID=A0A1U7V9H9_NICSY|nr:PREDICTED: mitochondrial dicarboxylate/tricarboxylate transporter DTC-like [Nicotiana sylvestris]